MNDTEKPVMLRRFGATVLLATICSSAFGVNDEPLTENWAPSVFGADDMAGSVNWTTPETVMKGIKLVKQGKGGHAW